METTAALPAPPVAPWPPGPSGLRFLLAAVMPRSTPIARFAWLQRRYGNTFGFTLRGHRFVMCIGADANAYLLGAGAAKFAQGAAARLGGALGAGLLTSEGELHARQRRLVMPAFHRSSIERYQSAMVADTRRMLDGWRAGQTLDFSAAMHALTLVIAGRTLFGVDLAGEAGDLGHAIATIIDSLRVRPLSLHNIRRDLPGLPYRNVKKQGAVLDRLVYGIIAARRASGEQTDDVLSMLLAARDTDGAAMDERQLRDEVMTLLAAGHETTANALGWTFMLLAQHPDAYARLVDEIAATLGDAPPTPADLVRLPYLDAVVKESLRLYPPAWAGVRVAKEAVDLRGYRFPAGTVVMFSQYFTHRMAAYYAEPERFLPERWDAAHGEAHPPYAYIPFGMGPRSCIGSGFALMELKTVIPTILQRFRPALVPGQRIALEPVITLRPRRGIHMRVEPR